MLPAPFWLALVRAMLVVDDGTRITPLSLHGEGKEEAAWPQKRKPTPPRCARQPLPREGARVDTPSFLWKEVPQRGGGWMGKAVFLYRSLPLEGNAIKLSKILIAHASNSVCFFHALSLPVNNKIKKLVE